MPERTYAFDVVFSEWLGFDYDLGFDDGESVTIQLVGDPDGRELRLPDTLFATPSHEWLTEASMPAIPLSRVAPRATLPADDQSEFGLPVSIPERIPILYGPADPEGRIAHPTSAGLAVTFDVFGGIFYLLTRYEEVVRGVRDAHERFPATASVAMAEGFLERPLVDEYVDILWMSMKSLWPALSRPSTPFRLRLTHDVDQPWAGMGQRAGAVAHALLGDLLKRRDITLAAQRALSFVSARAGRLRYDPYDTFDLLMDTSERHGLRSVFYFLADNAGGEFAGSYLLSDPPIADLLRRIHARGHEIGLHASYLSYRSAEQTAREFQALRSACERVGIDQPTWGVRQHFLRLAVPETWRNHETAGLEHDSTLGFADAIGFRAGTCREYPIFDLPARRAMQLRERPLVVMDQTMSEEMALDRAEAAARTHALVDRCKERGGDAVLLYHNSNIAGHGQGRHYAETIEGLARSSHVRERRVIPN